MIDLIYMYQLRACVRAHQIPNVELELSLDLPRTYISENDDATVAVKAEEIKKIMKDNLALLPNILPADITDMEDAIAAYNAALSAPKIAIDDRKAFGSDPIPDLINDSDIPKNNIGKLVHSYLPDLAHDFDIIARIGKSTGVRHTSIAVQYTDDATGVHLKNIKCTITKGQETIIKKSTKTGWVRAYSLDSGNWIVTSEDPEYTTDIQTNVGVDEDHIERFYIKLKKKDPNDPETTTGAYDLFAYDKVTLAPLPGVQVSIPELDYVNTTDEDGEDTKDMITPGQYTGTLFLTGYLPLDFVFTIEAAKTTTLQLYLESPTE